MAAPKRTDRIAALGQFLRAKVAPKRLPSAPASKRTGSNQVFAKLI